MKRLSVIGIAFGLTLFVVGCATFKKPAAIDQASIRLRAHTKEENGIRVSTALVDDAEARQIFGIDLSKKRIQALWLMIENNTDRSLLLLPSAIDPAYFAPLEVAFAFHKMFASDANKALDELLLDMNFPTRSPILPGTKNYGYIFTSWSKHVKALDVDLIGNGFVQNFTFFDPNPNSTLSPEIFKKIDTVDSHIAPSNVASEADLRRVLENLPSCVTTENGGISAEPLNIVVIGSIDDWTTAFIRRGYRYHPLPPRYAFGRSQDISGKKLRRGYMQTQAHTFRLWKTPIRYHGQTIWVGQASNRLGGRFADQTDSESTRPIDPYVDESRNDLTQDLAYSQALIKIGYVKGAGRFQSTPSQDPTSEIQYTTDGLRAVLVFGARPASLDTIDFFDWERLSDYH